MNEPRIRSNVAKARGSQGNSKEEPSKTTPLQTVSQKNDANLQKKVSIVAPSVNDELALAHEWGTLKFI